MLAIGKIVHFGFWVLLLSHYVSTNPRRLRVKTIANITAETTTESLVTIPITSLEPTTEITTDNEETTTVRAIRRRPRPTRPTSTTTEKANVSQHTRELSSRNIAESGRRNRGRVTWQKISVGNATEATNVTTTGDVKVTETPVGRRGSNLAHNPEVDAQSSSIAQRTLIKPKRNSTSTYNFETGRINRRPIDQNVSTTNQIDDRKDEEPTLPVSEVQPKRFSSRYSKPLPQEIDQEEPAEEIVEAEDSEEDEGEENDTKGLLFDGDYRELESDDSDDSEGAYNENVIDEAPEVQESGELKKGGKGKGGGSSKSEKGSGEEHHADVKASKGHKDQKAYKGKHHFHKGAKGFHDKEGHKGEYKDEKGSKKGHKEGGGHFESGHHGEKGEKEAEHAEKEEYKKGHSTRGGHVIHKKDEYEKKMEFFDESHEDGNGEKFGAYFESHAGKKGGHKKEGHKDSSSEGKHQAKKGHFTKGSHGSEDKGHSKKAGKEGKHGVHEELGKKGSKKDAKSYHFDHASGKPKTGGGDGKKAHLEKGHEEENQKNANEPNEQVEKDNEEIKQEVESDGEEEEVEEESKEVKKVAIKDKKTPIKNAEYMNQNGPTSYYTQRQYPSSVQNSLTSIPEKPFVSFEKVTPNRKGKFMTEEELREDKQGEAALHVFSPLHEHIDDGKHSRGYRVAEPNVEDEPRHEESRRYISRMNVQSSHEPVQIVAMYKLPPL